MSGRRHSALSHILLLGFMSEKVDLFATGLPIFSIWQIMDHN